MGSSLRSFARGLPVMFDEYKESTTYFVSNLAGGIFWIISAISGWPGFIIIALSLHLFPLLPYYWRYGPFGIKFDSTPTTIIDGDEVPDKYGEKNNEIHLRNGKGAIHARIEISRRWDYFSIQFLAPSELTVELRDKPYSEHSYDREDRVLYGSNIRKHEFLIVLDIFDEGAIPGERYSLRVKDADNNRIIDKVEIVC